MIPSDKEDYEFVPHLFIPIHLLNSSIVNTDMIITNLTCLQPLPAGFLARIRTVTSFGYFV